MSDTPVTSVSVCHGELSKEKFLLRSSSGILMACSAFIFSEFFSSEIEVFLREVVE